MEDIKRIDLLVTSYSEKRLTEGMFSTVHPNETIKNATLFISKDDKPPKVFTEEQMKAMLREVLAISDTAPVKLFRRDGTIWDSELIDPNDLKKVAAKHGITL